MAVELKHLRVLEAVRRTGTISAAARELGYSQPAVSQQISAAERSLKTPLLHRTRSGATLTEAGEILVRAGDTVLPLIDRSLSEIEAIAGLRSGTVRIASFASAAAVLIPPTLTLIRQEHPGLQFVVTEREPARALEDLRRGDCDVAIVYEYSSQLAGDHTLELAPGEVDFTLAQESIRVALPSNHRLSTTSVVDLKDLAGETWVSSSSEGRSYFVELCEAVGFTPRVAFETHNHVAIQRLVAASHGVALLPELVAAAGGAVTEDLVLLPCSPTSVRTVRAVTTTSLLTVPGVPVAVDALRRAVVSLRPPATSGG